MFPAFERKVLEELPNGMLKVLNEDGVIVLEKPGVRSIPPEVGHLLKDRKSWEEHYLPRLQFTKDRVNVTALKEIAARPEREEPLGVYCTSLFGHIRGWMGLEGISYLLADDEPLYDDIIDTVGELAYRTTECILSVYADFDFGHFWEDICFRNGPLVSPRVFATKVGPHYQRITKLVNSYGINIVSLDCDGKIDALIPTWLQNGVNTMFPIEVGTWNASIRPWREKYGRELRGVGGMRKHAFAEDYAAIDAEIENLKGLVALGGFIPCPDHRIAPDAKWENVQYYWRENAEGLRLADLLLTDLRQDPTFLHLLPQVGELRRRFADRLSSFSTHSCSPSPLSSQDRLPADGDGLSGFRFASMSWHKWCVTLYCTQGAVAVEWMRVNPCRHRVVGWFPAFPSIGFLLRESSLCLASHRHEVGSNASVRSGEVLRSSSFWS